MERDRQKQQADAMPKKAFRDEAEFQTAARPEPKRTKLGKHVRQKDLSA